MSDDIKIDSKEIDKFLTEAMGKCWHQLPNGWHTSAHMCCKCNHDPDHTDEAFDLLENNFTFSSWEGFGRLIEWAMTQPWWQSFIFYMNQNRGIFIDWYSIHPDRFANILYTFLKNQ